MMTTMMTKTKIPTRTKTSDNGLRLHRELGKEGTVAYLDSLSAAWRISAITTSRPAKDPVS
jgi:hypothetical protein